MNHLVKCRRVLDVRLLGILTLSLLLGSTMTVMAQSTLSEPTSAGGVTPYIIAGENSGGNRTCAEVGTAFFGNANYYQCSSARIAADFENDLYGDITGNEGCDANDISVTTDGTYVAWTSTNGIGAAIVKGSNNANVYVYDPQETSDSGLASPINSSGHPAGLSNLTFCWNPVEPPPPASEWCSPGYWKNHSGEANVAAAACELDMDATTYDSQFGPVTRSPKGVSDGATASPTLRQVVNNPQWYGGGATNNVGDLLSECHPDVEFLGERVEDSCPLN